MRCKRARQLISLYVAPNPLGLSPEDRQALESHMAACEPCRRDCQEGREAVSLLREHWQISPDTLALMEQAQTRRTSPKHFVVRYIRRAAVVAACLALGVLGWWVVAGRGVLETSGRESVASSGPDTTLMIEVADGGRILAGTVIQTESGRTKELLVNGRHQIVVNAGSRLVLQPLVETGRVGCLVDLALGEIFVRVEHDGNPFVVQTAHGRAVITGTTFDVKVTEAGTILTVAEGSVRFESKREAVHVAGGQQSIIAAVSRPPSPPVACDVASVTAWATVDHAVAKIPQALPVDGLLLGDVTPSPSRGVLVNLEGIDFEEWLEENRGWFIRQFPDIFRLKEALAKEGIEADYPDLLLESGAVWQFTWPPTGRDRLLPVDDAAIIKAANHYGRDLQWLRARSLLHGAPDLTAEQASDPETFTLWQTESMVALEGDEAISAELLFDSLHACDYLRRTRSLIWLAADADRYSSPEMPKWQLKGLLQDVIVTADHCTNRCLQLVTAEKSSVPCDSEQYRQLIQEFHIAIGELGKMEGRLVHEMAYTHP